MHALKQANLEKSVVLIKAIQKLANELELSRHELSLILGRSEATFSRLFKNDPKIKDSNSKHLNFASKEGQLAVLLVRLYRSLDILFGGNKVQCQQWLRSDNKHLEKKPIDLIISVEGLVTVVQYLDAIRGKI